MRSHPRSAFSLLDLLATVATAGVILAVASVALSVEVNNNKQTFCLSNLKQIGLAMRMWSNDNNDIFPMRTKEAAGGSLEAIARAETYRHYLAISNELVSPKTLTCPADNRQRATNFATLRNDHISYFIALDADEAQPTRLLSGDRNITNGLPVVNGVLELRPKQPAGWTAAMHNGEGNLGLSDGSAHRSMDTGPLRKTLADTQDDRNRIQLPEAGSGSEE